MASKNLKARLNELAYDNATFIYLIAAALAFGFLPLLLMSLRPALNTPLVQTLCTSCQFFISIFAGVTWSKRQAEKEANSRWVPAAASACDRIMTIMGTVRGLRGTVSRTCSVAANDLPELKQQFNRAVRTHFEALCSSNAARLSDIESHLESGLADWERFVKQNCTGSECAEIGIRINQLRSKLLPREEAENQSVCGGSEKERAGTNIWAGELYPSAVATVMNVTTDPGQNGTWTLTRNRAGLWMCSDFILRHADEGWYLTPTVDPNSFFFRGGIEPNGDYQRCSTCNYDGFAIVNLVKDKNTLSFAGEADRSTGHLDGVGLGDRFAAVLLRQTTVLAHIVNDHGRTWAEIEVAMQSANDIRDFCQKLGETCVEVSRTPSVEAINAVRAMMGKSSFEYDKSFEEQLCYEQTQKRKSAEEQKARPCGEGK